MARMLLRLLKYYSIISGTVPIIIVLEAASVTDIHSDNGHCGSGLCDIHVVQKVYLHFITISLCDH